MKVFPSYVGQHSSSSYKIELKVKVQKAVIQYVCWRRNKYIIFGDSNNQSILYKKMEEGRGDCLSIKYNNQSLPLEIIL